MAALDFTTFDDLCELVILEQFKNTLPGRTATYINKRKIASAAEAAVSADEYVLLHKGDVRECTPGRNDTGWGGNRQGVVEADQMRYGKSGLFRAESHSRSSFDSSLTAVEAVTIVVRRAIGRLIVRGCGLNIGGATILLSRRRLLLRWLVAVLLMCFPLSVSRMFWRHMLLSLEVVLCRWLVAMLKSQLQS